MSEFEPPVVGEDPPFEPPGSEVETTEQQVPPTYAAWTPPPPHPIQLIVTDDLQRSRLTVFLRLFLMIPHFIWLVLFGIVMAVCVVIAWFCALVLGRVPNGLHGLIAAYARYSTQAIAYLMIAANPFPGFMGNTPYPIDLEVAPPARQNRLGVFFRIILAIPVVIMLDILQYLVWIPALIAWFVALFLGRVPQTIENMLTTYLRFSARTNGYIRLLTPKYPSFDQ